MNKICPKCKFENLTNSLYCQDCGTKLSSSSTSPELQSINEELKQIKDSVVKTKNNRSRLRTAFYVIGGLAIVFSVFMIWAMFAYPSSDSETTTTSTQGSCNEQESINQAKHCTYLIYRDDESYGSGFGIKPGFIVTNMHVVESAKEIVTFDGDEIPLTLWGYSEEDDIAVLKSDKNTDNCVWADSDQLKTAETVYAVGWPYTPEGESSISRGVISRIMKSEDDSVQLIQTDTAINPGNSGGPLVSKCGVIGINFAKLSWSDEETPLEGYGFALASNYSKPIVENLIAEGKPIKLPVKSVQQTIESTPESNNQVSITEEPPSVATPDLSGTFCPNPVEMISLTNIDALGTGRVRISWIPLSHSASSYSIFYSKTLTGFNLLTSGGSSGSVEVGSLEADTKYYFVVQFDWYQGPNHVCATSDAKSVMVK